ncbi:glycine receptor subunit beta-type 4-like [Homarus americanus]|nr:glycine receptor subunit beta-type 4-like [Homarus americanus]
MYKRLKLPQFEIKKISVDTCNQSFHIGNYSCLQAVFNLRRNIGYHLVQSYLPTSLIVVVSWVSFWLDVDAIPSRVTLGVTTLLTVCSESTSFRDKMPTVSYVKALDIWMGSCTAFVFLALVEFTVVNHIARHHRRFLFWGNVYGQPIPSSSTPPHAAPSHRHHLHPRSLGRFSSNECPTHGSIYACVRAITQSGGQEVLQRHDSGKHVRKKSAISLTVETRTDREEVNTRRSSNPEEETRPTPPPDVYQDVTNGGGHQGETGGGNNGASCCSNHENDDDDNEGSCSRTLSDVGLTCLPSLWRKEAMLAKRIDKTCRALFPALFILFNLVYWLYYQVFS